MIFNFPLRGGVIPRDHGYTVLSALSQSCPFLHGQRAIQIAPIRGTRGSNQNEIRLDAHSILHIRGITEAQAQQVGGSWMMVAGTVVGIGTGTLLTLNPSDHLVSHRVILRDTVDPDEFLSRVKHVINDSRVDVVLGRRSTLKFKGQCKIGYAVRLYGLPADLSLAIQEQGLGLCTSMGCGVFYPGTLAMALAAKAVA